MLLCLGAEVVIVKKSCLFRNIKSTARESTTLQMNHNSTNTQAKVFLNFTILYIGNSRIISSHHYQPHSRPI